MKLNNWACCEPCACQRADERACACPCERCER
jgi:hypothetical protein